MTGLTLSDADRDLIRSLIIADPDLVLNDDDVMRRLINWRNFGYMSSNKQADMSDQTAAALDRFEADGNPYAGAKEDNGAGSDGLVRIAPAVIAYAAKIESAAAERAAGISACCRVLAKAGLHPFQELARAFLGKDRDLVVVAIQVGQWPGGAMTGRLSANQWCP